MTLLALFVQAAVGAEIALFLNIGAGARGMGMGGAYTALADDANAPSGQKAPLNSSDRPAPKFSTVKSRVEYNSVLGRPNVDNRN